MQPKPLIPRVAWYVRVSTDGQDKAGTPATQRRRLQEIGDRRPHVLVPGSGPTGAHEDLGVSGTLPFRARPGSSALAKVIESKQVDELWVYSVCRLSRSDRMEELGGIADLLRANGVLLVEATGGEIDLRGSDAMSAGMLLLKLIAGADERRKILKRANDSKRDRTLAGRLALGAHCLPTGYRKVDGKVVIDEPRADLVRRVFRMAATSRSIDIVRALDGGELKPRHASGWSTSSISQILLNDTYWTGVFHVLMAAPPDTTAPQGVEVQPDGRWKIPVPVPPIIDEATFLRAQQARKLRRNLPDDELIKREALFRGIARCAHCGGPLTLLNRKNPRTGAYWPGYVCGRSKPRNGANRCPVRRIFSLPGVDEAGWKLLYDTLNANAMLPRVVFPDTATRTTWSEQEAAARASLVTIEAQVRNLVRRMATASDETAVIVQEQIQELDTDRARHTKRLEQAVRAQADHERVRLGWDQAVERFKAACRHLREATTYDDRRRLVVEFLGNGLGEMVVTTEAGPDRQRGGPFRVTIRCATLPRAPVTTRPMTGDTKLAPRRRRFLASDREIDRDFGALAVMSTGYRATSRASL